MVNIEEVRNGPLADVELVGPTLSVSVGAKSDPRENVLSIAEQRLKRSVRNTAPVGPLPAHPPGDPMEIASICRELVTGVIDGGDAAEITQRIRRAAVEWARQGVPIDDVLAAVYDGFESGASVIIGGWTTGDSSNLTSGVEWMLEVLSMTTSAIAVAYLDQGAIAGIEDQSAENALASAMLSVVGRQRARHHRHRRGHIDRL